MVKATEGDKEVEQYYKQVSLFSNNQLFLCDSHRKVGTPIHSFRRRPRLRLMVIEEKEREKREREGEDSTGKRKTEIEKD